MFQHPRFEIIGFEEVPLNRDIFLMSCQYCADYEAGWLEDFNGGKSFDYSVGYGTHVAARSLGNGWLEMSWYPNTYDRFHEVPIFLPQSAFVTCVEVADVDSSPYMFVDSKWLDHLHDCPLAAFAMIDGVGVKNLIQNGKLAPAALVSLRERIDEIADVHPSFAFFSFADSVLIKQMWSAGNVHSAKKYTYNPELMFPVVEQVIKSFQDSLEIDAYAILTQGFNAYADSDNLHYSSKINHISLNTLGLPFAQLMAIDDAARVAIKEKKISPQSLYLDLTVLNSLNFKASFDKNGLARYKYISPMTRSETAYIATAFDFIKKNLE